MAERFIRVPGLFGGRLSVRGLRVSLERLADIWMTYPRKSGSRIVADFPFLETRDLTRFSDWVNRYGMEGTGRIDYPRQLSQSPPSDSLEHGPSGLLLDLGVPPACAGLLRDSGQEAVHAADVGLVRALDAEISQYARDHRMAVVGYRYDLEPLVSIGEPSGLVLLDRRTMDADQVAAMLDRHRGYIATAWRERCTIALQPRSVESWKRIG